MRIVVTMLLTLILVSTTTITIIITPSVCYAPCLSTNNINIMLLKNLNHQLEVHTLELIHLAKKVSSETQP